MKRTKINKREYERPLIKRVKLDNKISLVMESPITPPPNNPLG